MPTFTSYTMAGAITLLQVLLLFTLHAHTAIIEIRLACMLDLCHIYCYFEKKGPKARGAKEDDKKKKDKVREAVKEQRHKEKEELLKRKADEKKAGTAPPPVKRTNREYWCE